MDIQELRHNVALILDLARNDAAVDAAEVCTSWSTCQTVQIDYDTARPGNGVQPRPERTVFGIGILVVVADQAGRRIGFGSTSGDLSWEGVNEALYKAKENAVPDPGFLGLPAAPEPTPAPDLADPQVAALQFDELQRLGTEALEGALVTFEAAGYVTALQVDGSVASRTEHLAIGNTNGVMHGETSTALLATISSRLPTEQAQGTGQTSATHVQAFAPYDAGADAARRALQARGAITVPAGDYTVIFGPQAASDLLQDLLLPALSLDTVAAGLSPFARQFGQRITSPLLSITDAGNLPGHLGSHAITGEGLPTGVVTLIDHGRLSGFLSDTYHARKLATQFGPQPPYHGMRFATNGESFAMRAGIFPTNIRVSGDNPQSLAALLAPITEGIYVGRLWNLSPLGGLHTGNCVGTVIGPSFRVQQGQLTQPIQPGTLHLHDNFVTLLQRLTGVSTARQAVPLATARSLVLSPEIRCSQAHFEA